MPGDQTQQSVLLTSSPDDFKAPRCTLKFANHCFIGPNFFMGKNKRQNKNLKEGTYRLKMKSQPIAIYMNFI